MDLEEKFVFAANVSPGKKGSAQAASASDPVDWAQLARELMMTARKAGPRHAHHASDLEMRGEVQVLHVLHHSPDGATPTELARACQVSSARMAKLVAQLESHGYVTREPSPTDGRRVIVRATQAGEAEVKRRGEEIVTYLAKVLQSLGENDARELVRITGRLAEAVQTVGCSGDGASAGDGASTGSSPDAADSSVSKETSR